MGADCPVSRFALPRLMVSSVGHAASSRCRSSSPRVITILPLPNGASSSTVFVNGTSHRRPSGYILIRQLTRSIRSSARKSRIRISHCWIRRSTSFRMYVLSPFSLLSFCI